MGGGSYSTSCSVDEATGATKYTRMDTGRTAFYSDQSIGETFKQTNINNKMNPYGLTIRESRDSEEHPESLGIIIGLDVTGSMGHIPHSLIKTGFPHMMGSIIQNGIADPQVLFLGIGDHTCDRSPLQVGQFESNDDLLDKWLETVWLEGGGGGNDGESYHIAWYLAAKHTDIDCFNKRQQKGFLFTIGDEPVLPDLDAYALKEMFGPGQYQDSENIIAKLLEAASERYHIFHIHVIETHSGSRQRVQDGWKQIMHDNVLFVNDHKEIPNLIAKTIAENMDSSVNFKVDPVLDAEINKTMNENVVDSINDGEML